MADIELSVVLPVYNEPGIAAVVREVVDLVDAVVPGRGEVIVVDDGSTDDTPARLDELARHMVTLTVIHQVNQGHGPAIWRGFADAKGHWIAHLDTDDQVPAAELARLWEARDGFDLVLGDRVKRHDPRHRLVLTSVVRWLTTRLAGRPIHDANVPCKVFTRDLWEQASALIPSDTFAPSIALVVVAARRDHRIQTLEVSHRERTQGETTLRPWRLARAIATSTVQTVRVSWRARNK